jgi:TolA-binding protein
VIVPFALGGKGKYQFLLNQKGFTFLFFLLVFSFANLPVGQGQVSSDEGRNFRYYYRLKSEEFLETVIPKEKYLLALVQNMNEELWSRMKEGAYSAELNVDKLESPDETLVDSYNKELEKVLLLFDEINLLEKKAKQKVNFEALKSLSNLRTRVRKIIEESVLDKYVGELDIKNGNGSSGYQKNSNVSKKEGTFTKDQEATRRQFVDEYFEQWKYNRILDFKTKLTKYIYLRTKLIKTADPFQLKRMFTRDLKVALGNFSAGDFALSRLQLQDILTTYYQYQALDDVLFYSCESSYGLNYLDEALKGYQRLSEEYPQSRFWAKSLVKMIYIYSIYDEVDHIHAVYQELLLQKQRLDAESFGIVSYLVGYAHFKAGNYQKSLKALGNISSESTYFFPSLYLSAACYSNLGEDRLAQSLYYRLIEEKQRSEKDPVLHQIRNNALLKLGLIYYERGEHQQAIAFFNMVSEDYSHYDLSVIGRAWSAYQIGNPAETLQNAEWLLKNSLMSRYAYEARVLAASSRELMGKSEEAIEDLKQVYQAKFRADQNDLLPEDQKAMMGDVNAVEAYERNILDTKEQKLYNEIDKIQQFFRGTNLGDRVAVSSSSRTDADYKRETKTLESKIALLDRLEREARENQQSDLLDEIRLLRSDLIQTLESHSQTRYKRTEYYDEDPLIRRMGISEHLKYLFQSLMLETTREKDQTVKDIETAQKIIRQAKMQDQYNLVIQTEIKEEELEDYYNRLNQYEVWLRENFPQQMRVELDQWASFSGYGISNINFSRIKTCDRHMADISKNIQKIDEIYLIKRKQLDRRIQGLLSDVEKIENQMRSEAMKREEQEKDRFFKTDYFYKQKQEAPVGEIQETPDSKKSK